MINDNGNKKENNRLDEEKAPRELNSKKPLLPEDDVGGMKSSQLSIGKRSR